MDKPKGKHSATFEQAVQLEHCWADLLRDVEREDLLGSSGVAAQRLIERFDVVHAIMRGCFTDNALVVHKHVRTTVNHNLTFAEAWKASKAKFPEEADGFARGIDRWFHEDWDVYEVTLEVVAFTSIPSYGGPEGKMPNVALAEFGLRPADTRDMLAFAAVCNPAELMPCVIYAWGDVMRDDEGICPTIQNRRGDDSRSVWCATNRGLAGISSYMSSRNLLLAVRDEKRVG